MFIAHLEKKFALTSVLNLTAECR